MLDASSCIAFLQDVERPDLLEALTGLGFKLVVPAAVAAEVTDARARRCLAESTYIRVLAEDASNSADLAARYPQLGDGEVAVMAWVQAQASNSSVACVLDDGVARRIAQRLMLQYTGTIGLLDRLVEGGTLTTEAKASLQSTLIKRGFRYKPPS